MEKITLNYNEIIELFGSEANKATHSAGNTVRGNSFKAMKKSAEQRYERVDQVGKGKKIQFICSGELEVERPRELNYDRRPKVAYNQNGELGTMTYHCEPLYNYVPEEGEEEGLKGSRTGWMRNINMISEGDKDLYKSKFDPKLALKYTEHLIEVGIFEDMNDSAIISDYITSTIEPMKKVMITEFQRLKKANLIDFGDAYGVLYEVIDKVTGSKTTRHEWVNHTVYNRFTKAMDLMLKDSGLAKDDLYFTPKDKKDAVSKFNKKWSKRVREINWGTEIERKGAFQFYKGLWVSVSANPNDFNRYIKKRGGDTSPDALIIAQESFRVKLAEKIKTEANNRQVARKKAVEQLIISEQEKELEAEQARVMELEKHSGFYNNVSEGDFDEDVESNQENGLELYKLVNSKVEVEHTDKKGKKVIKKISNSASGQKYDGTFVDKTVNLHEYLQDKTISSEIAKHEEKEKMIANEEEYIQLSLPFS